MYLNKEPEEEKILPGVVLSNVFFHKSWMSNLSMNLLLLPDIVLTRPIV